jgi:N-acetylneuraminic acid mutarotase
MGYFAMGKLDNNYYTYMMQYNPDNDSWLYLTPNPGPGSSLDSPGFVINGKAYFPAAGKMHEYNPTTQIWTEKSFPEDLGYFGGGAAFSINGKGYLGVGWVHGKASNVSDFYEYDPGTDTWTKKASFPGPVRGNPTSFALPNGKGYVGMGYSNSLSIYYNDMWEYDPVLDTWTRTVDFPASPRFGARAYVIGSDAYIVSGYGGIYERDMWRFSPPR